MKQKEKEFASNTKDCLRKDNLGRKHFTLFLNGK